MLNIIASVFRSGVNTNILDGDKRGRIGLVGFCTPSYYPDVSAGVISRICPF